MNIVDIDSLTSDYKKLLLTSMVIDNSLDVTFKYNADYLNTKILRDFVDEAFTLFDVDKKWISRLILISDELNNNAIEYGSKKGDINTMRLVTDGINVSIEVTDTGRGIEAKSAEEMCVLRDAKATKGFNNHKSIRGRGLFMIITRLVDELNFEDSEKGGLIVSIKKAL